MDDNDENYTKEKALKNASEPIPFDILKIIIEQIEKCICRINCKDGGTGTGFFCLIPFPDKCNLLPVLMTNNHVLDEEDISKNKRIQFFVNNDKTKIEIEIDYSRKTYTNHKYDVTIIEIKKIDGLNINTFLEIDNNFFKYDEKPNDIYKNTSIYIIYYPPGKKAAYSNGIIKKIGDNNYTIQHLCPSVPGSSGSPIIGLNNNRVIGIHKGASNFNWNLGTFLKEPIENFYKEKGIIKINDNDLILKEKINLTSKLGPINITSLLLLQIIIQKKNYLDISSLTQEFSENIKKEIEKIYKKIRYCEYITLGTNVFFEKCNNLLNISLNKEEITQKIKERLKNNYYDDINMLEISKNFRLKDFDNIISKISEKDEFYIINKLYDFNIAFDKEMDEALKNSIFEYKITYIIVVYPEFTNYCLEKNKCLNRITKILFHGTRANIIIPILSHNFIVPRMGMNILGKSIFLTDSLDYCYYYSGEIRNIGKIPKIGDTISIVGSEIYYDKTKLENIYDYANKYEYIPKNGIRYAYGNYETKLMSNKELKDYKGFICKDILISEKDQILPLYGIILKRIEYLVIWRDYNFNSNNPNKYDINKFREIEEFHRNIKKIISREYDSNIYYIENTEEALELINRKKYNKIIIITNGNNNAEEFINKSRNIIGANTISAISTFNINSKINWIKNMKNIIVLNGIYFHIRFFKNLYNKEELIQLKNDIKNYYSNIPPCEFDNDLLNFASFKNAGNWSELKF